MNEDEQSPFILFDKKHKLKAIKNRYKRKSYNRYKSYKRKRALPIKRVIPTEIPNILKT